MKIYSDSEERILKHFGYRLDEKDAPLWEAVLSVISIRYQYFIQRVLKWLNCSAERKTMIPYAKKSPLSCFESGDFVYRRFWLLILQVPCDNIISCGRLRRLNPKRHTAHKPPHSCFEYNRTALDRTPFFPLWFPSGSRGGQAQALLSQIPQA